MSNRNEGTADIVVADVLDVPGSEEVMSPSSASNLNAVANSEGADVGEEEQLSSTTTRPHHLMGDVSSSNIDNFPKEEVDTTESLATTYGKRPSRFLLLSLLINIALLIYAHTGLSAVVLSNIERVETNESENGNNNSNNTNGTGACTKNESDLNRWYNAGGSLQKSIESSYCGTQYGGSGCLTGVDCTIECFVTVWNYTEECATCFGSIPLCSLNDGCAVVCQMNNGVNEECQTCTKSCNEVFLSCSGFTFVDNATASNNTTNGMNFTDNSITTSIINASSTNEEICAAQQANVSYTEDVDEFYIVYELKFFSAVQRAWTSNAKLLALIVVLFSGVWPYTKNLLMCYIWYYNIPTSTTTKNGNDTDVDSTDLSLKMFRQRHAMILWLKRLGKWSLVDVYIIVIILIGLTLQISLNNGTVPLILKGEPRHAIIAFLFATIWSFIHLEVVNEYHMHQLHQHYETLTFSGTCQGPQCRVDALDDDDINKETEITPTATSNLAMTQQQPTTTNVYDALRIFPWRNASTSPQWKFRNATVGRLLLLVLYVSTVATLLVGSIYDVVHFTSYVTDADPTTTNEPGCIQAYNVYTLGTMMVSNFFLYDNSALPGVYILFISYVLFVMVAHLLVHGIHISILLFHSIPKQSLICRLADITWTYASVEVLLLGIFAVQYKFEELVAALAGNDGSQFFGMRSDLQKGFFILIGYSVLGSVCHYIFQCTVIEYYHLHPFQRLRNVFGARTYCGFLLIESKD